MLGFLFVYVYNYFEFGEALSPSNFTLVGMASVLGGVLHAPLTGIFLIAEITGGYELFLPLMITATISYLFTKNVMDHTIYTRELAKQGALLTHNKDKNVLTLMQLDDVIEDNFKSVTPNMTLGKMLHEAVAKSARNIFPVIDENDALVGIVLLDDIREFMFDVKLHNTTTVETFMGNAPEHIFYETDTMQKVMEKFQDSGAWNLPVIKNGKYAGFVSKSKLLTAYRRKLIILQRA